MNYATDGTFDSKLWFAAAIMQTEIDLPRHHSAGWRVGLSLENCPNREKFVDEYRAAKGYSTGTCSGNCRCDWHGTKWCKKR